MCTVATPRATCPLCGKPGVFDGTMPTPRAGEVTVFHCPRCDMPWRLPLNLQMPLYFALDREGRVLRPDLQPEEF